MALLLHTRAHRDSRVVRRIRFTVDKMVTRCVCTKIWQLLQQICDMWQELYIRLEVSKLLAGISTLSYCDAPRPSLSNCATASNILMATISQAATVSGLVCKGTAPKQSPSKFGTSLCRKSFSGQAVEMASVISTRPPSSFRSTTRAVAVEADTAVETVNIADDVTQVRFVIYVRD